MAKFFDPDFLTPGAGWMKTIEDTLTEDLAEYWGKNRPAGLPAGWGIHHAKRAEGRELPCVVVGDQGFQRQAGMPDTGTVDLRVMVLSCPDDMTAADHRAVAGLLDEALLRLSAQDAVLLGLETVELPDCKVHALLMEAPEYGIAQREDRAREEFTVLKRKAVVSRYRG